MTRTALRPRRAWAFLLLLTAGAAILYAHEGHDAIPTRGLHVDQAAGIVGLGREAHQALGVETAPVTDAPVPETVLAYVTLEAPWPGRGFASARLPGRVVAVHARPGQAVEAGQVLAEVASPAVEALRLDQLTARSELAAAEQALRGLEQAAGSVPGQTVLDARFKVRQQRVAVEVAKARWHALGLPADRSAALLPVVSPVRGTVVRADAAAGKVVDPTEPLFELVDTSRVWARIGVLEKDLTRVAIGRPVEVTLTAYPGEVFRGAVTAIGVGLDPVTHLAPVWADFDNPPGEPRLLPGMTGQARVVLPPQGKTFTVPATAVVDNGLDRFVLVEDADTGEAVEYRKVSVEVVRRTADVAAVRSGGLLTGDRVVIQGSGVLGGTLHPEVFRLSPEAERQLGLRVESVEPRPVEDVAEAEGLVDLPPARRAAASSQFPGTVARVGVDRGRPVRRGDVLADVFSPEFHALQADLLRDHLTAELLAEQVRLLKAGTGVSPRRLLDAETAAAAAALKRDNVRRQVELAGVAAVEIDTFLATRRLIEAVPVKAPIDGLVAGLDRAVGQSVRAEEPIVPVHDPSVPVVRAFVPERDAGRVRVGQPVRLRFAADPDAVIPGKVVRSSRTFSPEAAALTVWVEPNLPPGVRLLPNQLARVTFPVRASSLRLAVPHGAVVREGTQAFVFIRRPDGTWDRRAVALGRADDRFVEVTAGLTAGEPVAAAGAAGLQTAFASIR
jgi:RND family efflux transporter MFP subunit